MWAVYQALICKTATFDTMKAFQKVFCWSLYWLFRGVWPDRDWNLKFYTSGMEFARRLTPLANGYCGVVWAIKQDLEMFWKGLDLPY